MKLNHVKRSVVVLAAVFAAMSTSAVAETTVQQKADSMASKAVQLSDAELDNITGGLTALFLANTGNASVETFNKNVGVCVNCAGTPPSNGPAVGVLFVENRGQTTPKEIIIGRPHFQF